MIQNKLLVVALGGNAILQYGEKGTFEEQYHNVDVTCQQIIKIHQLGYKLCVTHGNGPQSGNLLIQQDEGKSKVPAQPLDVVGAMTQGQIGYMFQNCLQNNFKKANVPANIATVVSQVLVSRDDPDFQDPTKPVGPFYTEEVAKEVEKTGYKVKKVKPGAEKEWRVVVPSPEPMELIEADAVMGMLQNGTIVITSGGGGIPVSREADGTLKGVWAVIDKDKAGNILAQRIKANIFLILTDVENACINYKKENEQKVGAITVAEAEKLFEEGHFLKGSMGPKVLAAIRFVKSGGEKAIITSLSKAIDALDGKTGTIITP